MGDRQGRGALVASACARAGAGWARRNMARPLFLILISKLSDFGAGAEREREIAEEMEEWYAAGESRVVRHGM